MFKWDFWRAKRASLQTLFSKANRVTILWSIIEILQPSHPRILFSKTLQKKIQNWSQLPRYFFKACFIFRFRQSSMTDEKCTLIGRTTIYGQIISFILQQAGIFEWLWKKTPTFHTDWKHSTFYITNSVWILCTLQKILQSFIILTPLKIIVYYGKNCEERVFCAKEPSFIFAHMEFVQTTNVWIDDVHAQSKQTDSMTRVGTQLIFVHVDDVIQAHTSVTSLAEKFQPGKYKSKLLDLTNCNTQNV